MKSRWALAPLVACHLALLWIWDLGGRFELVLGVLGVAMLTLVVAVRSGKPTSAMAVVGVAALLRLIMLPVPATLSDDVSRYIWDGRVAALGSNPYALSPDSEELAALRDTYPAPVPHPEVPTVYPPLALTLFSIASRFPASEHLWKLLLVTVELLGCWLLVQLARARAVPIERAAWYAWNPLVVLEVAGMGHVDAIGVTGVLLALFALVRMPHRGGLAGTAATMGILAKLVPVFAIPGWARVSRSPAAFVGTVAVLCGVAFAPVLLATGGVPPGLVEFGVSWEFNGPLFEPLWRLLDRIEISSSIKSILDGLKDLTGWHLFWNRVYPFIYPQLLAKIALGGLFALLWWRRWRDDDPMRSSGRIFAALIICSATVYPWYLLWVLPWAALELEAAWLVLSGTILLSYIPQFTEVELFPWLFLVIWAPVLGLSVARSRWKASTH